MGLIYYLKKKIAIWRLKKKYPEDEYNRGELEFVWGVVSWDNLLKTTANFYTMNDIEIYYNRYTEMYHLDIELAYRFPDDNAKIAYFEYLLDEFTKFIKQNDYPPYYIGELDWTFPNIKMEAESIPGLYTNFKLLVEGYKAVHSGCIAPRNAADAELYKEYYETIDTYEKADYGGVEDYIDVWTKINKGCARKDE